MRLIDADALKQELRKCQIESLIEHTEEKNVFDIINEQPIAYSVEKVLEQLEEAKKKDPCFGRSCMECEAKYPHDDCPSEKVALDVAIEIVNQVAEEYSNSEIPNKSEIPTGWIPVLEAHPDSERYILLSFENFSLPAIGRYEEDDNGGAFYIGDEDETCASRDIFVNAWMELPPRYKE